MSGPAASGGKFEKSVYFLCEDNIECTFRICAGVHFVQLGASLQVGDLRRAQELRLARCLQPGTSSTRAEGTGRRGSADATE